MSDQQDQWKQNVADLRKTIAKSKELSGEMQDTGTEIDAQIARARKLSKKKSKISFSQAIKNQV